MTECVVYAHFTYDVQQSLYSH